MKDFILRCLEKSFGSYQTNNLASPKFQQSHDELNGKVGITFFCSRMIKKIFNFCFSIHSIIFMSKHASKSLKLVFQKVLRRLQLKTSKLFFLLYCYRIRMFWLVH